MEVKLFKPEFLAEEMLRTQSDQYLQKSNRMYVGIYDEKSNWFIPLRGNLPKKAPKDGVFETPFNNGNTHLGRPGLIFKKPSTLPIEML